MVLVRLLGGLEFLELVALDNFLRWRSPEVIDERILIIEINEKDISNLESYPISDRDFSSNDYLSPSNNLSIGQLLAFKAMTDNFLGFIATIVGFVDEYTRAKTATQRYRDRAATRFSRDRIFIKDIQVLGNTVLQTEINKLIQESRLKYRTATFEDLVCLRSRITNLYLENDYITSGAFLVNNQDLSQGIVQIQIVEGEVETIQISGLKRLKENYIRSRLSRAASKPLNRASLERELQLLVLNPLIANVNAELTAGKQAGSNILLLELREADAFSTVLAIDNYRSPQIGEIQGTINLTHNNLLGFGDRINAQYGITEGLNILNSSYAIPLNNYDGTLILGYDNSDSDIVEEQFRDLDKEIPFKKMDYIFH